MKVAGIEARLDKLLSTAQAETANVDLFALITDREECPICMLPLPIVENKITFKTCCGKSICDGCIYKHWMNETKNGIPNHKQICAFCRQPDPNNDIKAYKKLMKKNNPDAFILMGNRYKQGEGVIQSDTKALEMIIHAAELGKAEAYALIARHYDRGTAVEQDESKCQAFYEISAKKGCVQAHRWVALFHAMNGNTQNSMKHLNVAACAGDQVAMDGLMEAYKAGGIAKEDLTQTLRASQTSKNEMKSKDRDDARTAKDNGLW